MLISELPIHDQRRALLYILHNAGDDAVSLDYSLDGYTTRRISSDSFSTSVYNHNNETGKLYNMGNVPVTYDDIKTIYPLMTRLKLTDYETSGNIRIRSDVVEGLNVSLPDTEPNIKSMFTEFTLRGRVKCYGIRLNGNIVLASSPDNNIPNTIWIQIEALPASFVVDPDKIIDNWSAMFLEFTQQRLRSSEASLIKIKKRILTEQRNFGKLKMINDIIKAGGRQYILQSVDNLKGMAEVEDVQLLNGSILITTKHLCSDPVMYGGEMLPSKYVGKWEISIRSDLSNINIRNIASPIKDRQACHAGTNHACLGGFADTLGAALQAFDLQQIVANSIEFLRNFTPSDLTGMLVFKSIPNSKVPPAKPHVFKEWVKLIDYTGLHDDD